MSSRRIRLSSREDATVTRSGRRPAGAAWKGSASSFRSLSSSTALSSRGTETTADASKLSSRREPVSAATTSPITMAVAKSTRRARTKVRSKTMAKLRETRCMRLMNRQSMKFQPVIIQRWLPIQRRGYARQLGLETGLRRGLFRPRSARPQGDLPPLNAFDRVPAPNDPGIPPVKPAAILPRPWANISRLGLCWVPVMASTRRAIMKVERRGKQGHDEGRLQRMQEEFEGYCRQLKTRQARGDLTHGGGVPKQQPPGNNADDKRYKESRREAQEPPSPTKGPPRRK